MLNPSRTIKATARSESLSRRAAPLLEALEKRTLMDATAVDFALAPEHRTIGVPCIVGAADLVDLGDDLRTLTGESAVGWISQWSVPAADQAVSQADALTGGSRLDDGSGDGRTDADIYSFLRPAPIIRSSPSPSKASPAISSEEVPSLDWLAVVSPLLAESGQQQVIYRGLDG